MLLFAGEVLGEDVRKLGAVRGELVRRAGHDAELHGADVFEEDVGVLGSDGGLQIVEDGGGDVARGICILLECLEDVVRGDRRGFGAP